MSTLSTRLDGFQRRNPWAGLPLAVIYKFVDDQGGYLTAMITYYGFLSVFPLLLLLVTILGFLLEGDTHLQEVVLDSALSRFPVIGDQLGQNVHSLQGSNVALAIGFIGSLYGSLGVAQATQNAFNKVWGVPRHARPNPFSARLRSLLAVAVIGGGLLLSTILPGLASGALDGGTAGALLTAAGTLAAIALNAGLFMVAGRMLTSRSLGWAQLWPGALLGAVAWQGLQSLGSYYLRHALADASATYGLFGIVLGLVAWLYLTAFILVLCTEVNVVRVERLWPRSLLTPFTDNVHLTEADRAAYESYAVTEKHKGFERVDVDFDDPPRRTRHTP